MHEAACAHPTKTGNELMEILDEMDQSHRKEMQLYNSIFSLLSFEKIGYTGEAPRRPLHAAQAGGVGCGGWGTAVSEQWAQAMLDGQALDKLLVTGRTPWGRRCARGRAGDGPGQDPGGTCMALRGPLTCPPLPGPATPMRWHPTAWGCTALGLSGSKQKVGVTWRAREPGACPVEPKARRALSTSGPACRQLLQWPRAS